MKLGIYNNTSMLASFDAYLCKLQFQTQQKSLDQISLILFEILNKYFDSSFQNENALKTFGIYLWIALIIEILTHL